MTNWKHLAEGYQKRMARIAEIMTNVGARRAEMGVLRITMSAEITTAEIQEIEFLLKSPVMDFGRKD